jgi:hypothetical protein
MTRNRASARKAGTAFETTVARYLALTLEDDRIERRARNDSKDRGDISGVRHMTGRVVVECKDMGGQLRVGEWLTETEIERLNDDAIAGLAVCKRRGKAQPGDQVVLLTLRDLVALLTGQRPPEEAD